MNCPNCNASYGRVPKNGICLCCSTHVWEGQPIYKAIALALSMKSFAFRQNTDNLVALLSDDKLEYQLAREQSHGNKLAFWVIFEERATLLVVTPHLIDSFYIDVYDYDQDWAKSDFLFTETRKRLFRPVPKTEASPNSI